LKVNDNQLLPRNEFLNKEYNMIKEPYLIQRASVKTHAINAETKTGDYLNLDYMGSAEFEFGAFPKFQREVFLKLQDLQIFDLTHKETTLFFFATVADSSEYKEMIIKLLSGETYTKARVGFSEKQTMYLLKGKKKEAVFNHPEAPFQFDTWCDLSNNLIFSRKKEVLETLLKTIPNSIKYMDENKK
jgi:hypothetical protein